MHYVKQTKQFIKTIPLKLRIAYNLRFVLQHFFGFKALTSFYASWNKNIQKGIFDSIKKLDRGQLEVDEFESTVDPYLIRKNYIRKGVPFVIRKGAASWPALKKWDFSFFREEYGDHPVLLTNHSDLGDDERIPSTETNLKNIIDGIDHNSLKYARFNPLLDTYPVLQEDLNQDWLDKVRDTKFMKHHALFIGNKGTKTNIHNAGNDNIFIQIRGRKRWLIWDQSSYYIFNPEVNRAPAKSSPINPNEIPNEENPSYNHTPYYETILDEGDIMFIPAYMWHYVENLTPTIGLGARWLSPLNTIKNNPLFAILELFNTSPSIFKTMDWRNGFDFNKIILNNRNKKERKIK